MRHAHKKIDILVWCCPVAARCLSTLPCLSLGHHAVEIHVVRLRLTSYTGDASLHRATRLFLFTRYLYILICICVAETTGPHTTPPFNLGRSQLGLMPSSELSNALNPYISQSRTRQSAPEYLLSYEPVAQPPPQQYIPHRSELELAVSEPPPPPPPQVLFTLKI